jgi:hypothetical protein
LELGSRVLGLLGSVLLWSTVLFFLFLKLFQYSIRIGIDEIHIPIPQFDENISIPIMNTGSPQINSNTNIYQFVLNAMILDPPLVSEVQQGIDRSAAARGESRTLELLDTFPFPNRLSVPGFVNTLPSIRYLTTYFCKNMY